MLIVFIDKITERVGEVTAVLTIVMALTTGAVVLFRYFLGGGSIALQESIMYLHSAIFLCGASVGLKYGAHVRVDIIYRTLNRHQQAWLNAIGSITLLLPFCIFIVAMCWHYVASSWAINEVSADAGGLAYVWLLKTLMLVGGSLLGMQAIAELLRNINVLMRQTGEAE